MSNNPDLPDDRPVPPEPGQALGSAPEAVFRPAFEASAVKNPISALLRPSMTTKNAISALLRPSMTTKNAISAFSGSSTAEENAISALLRPSMTTKNAIAGLAGISKPFATTKNAIAGLSPIEDAFRPIGPPPQFAALANLPATLHHEPTERADLMYRRVLDHFAEFEKKLAPHEETAVYLANLGRELLVIVEGLGYRNPYLFVLYGRDELGRRVEHLQHLSQTNILLVAVPTDGNRPARRIELRHPEETEGEPE